MKTYTLTSVFLLPILPIKLYELEQFGFENAYLGDKGFSEETGVKFENTLCLLFNVQFNEVYRKFEQKLKQIPLFDFDYDPELGKTMYVFKLPEDCIDEIEKFKQGRYSQLSKEFISKYYLENYDAYKIWSKDEFFKNYWEEKLDIKLSNDLEVWQSPNMEKEIYRFN